MYDDKNIEILDKALTIIAEVRRALSNGTKHFRKSDRKFLETPIEIIQTLVDEGEIIFEPRKTRKKEAQRYKDTMNSMSEEEEEQ